MNQNEQTILVVAAVVSTTDVILYSPSGEQVTLKQGDLRVPGIIEVLKQKTPSLAEPVEISLAGPAAVPTVFDAFSEKSGEIISFFRVAKQFLDKIFADEATAQTEAKKADPVAPQTFGSVNVLDEIMAHARPTGEAIEDSTVVAVVNGQVLSGMEHLTEQVKYANTNGTKGLEALLVRMATVASKRRHSADDLMKFLKRADLPIADDGCIIGYKNLSQGEGAEYVDAHTKKVKQQVGDFVCMDESMVDPNRRQDCSNGLHIASRGYLSGFNTNGGTFLCKIAPEDVIAVPEYDSTKMRVCGYHILRKLNDAHSKLVNSDQPITNDEHGGNVLGQVIAGNHVGRLREVRIGGAKGTNITYTTLEQAPRVHPKDKVKKVVKDAGTLENATDSENGLNKKANVVDPSTLAQGGTSKRIQTAAKLMALMQKARSKKAAREAANNLKDFKKKSKVGWDRLGISETEVVLIEQAAAQ